MKWWYMLPVLLLCLLAIGLWQYLHRTEQSVKEPLATREAYTPQEPIQPIPLQVALNDTKVKLGEKLFHDRRLSHDNSVSCADCHNLETGGTDRRRRSIGINGAESSVNTPTVFNSGFNFRQFWDGRAETLEDQIDGPINSPHELASNWQEVGAKLSASPDYVAAFEAAYQDGINPDNIRDAIATFERSLYTPNARFDQFLRGDSEALSEAEKAGYHLFKTYGCIRCHQGINIGGNLFQTFGVMGNYFTDRGNMTKADLGRFNVTGEEHDRHVFKVPSLRNAAVTPPYFHDGSATRLEDAVTIMATYQLGRKLDPSEVDLIVQFLQTLTGTYKEKPL